jgi:3-(3-hydroxy-phenyl)propionate hydroxylase
LHAAATYHPPSLEMLAPSGVTDDLHAAGIIARTWLVGADGGRSVVRKTQGIDFAGFTWPERFLVVTTDFDFVSLGFAFSSYTMDPLEWTATFKIPGEDGRGLWRCVFPTDPAAPERELLDFELAANRLADFVPASRGARIVHTNLYAVHQRVSQRYRVGRVLLAGDAAYVNNPRGGSDRVSVSRRLTSCVAAGTAGTCS